MNRWWTSTSAALKKHLEQGGLQLLPIPDGFHKLKSKVDMAPIGLILATVRAAREYEHGLSGGDRDPAWSLLVLGNISGAEPIPGAEPPPPLPPEGEPDWIEFVAVPVADMEGSPEQDVFFRISKIHANGTVLDRRYFDTVRAFQTVWICFLVCSFR